MSRVNEVTCHYTVPGIWRTMESKESCLLNIKRLTFANKIKIKWTYFVRRRETSKWYDPYRELTNLNNWGKTCRKKPTASTRFDPVTSANTSEMLCRLNDSSCRSLLRRGLFRAPWPCRQCGGWGEGYRKRAEHHTGICGGHGFQSCRSPDFFSRLLFPSCINWWLTVSIVTEKCHCLFLSAVQNNSIYSRTQKMTCPWSRSLLM